MFLKFLQRTQLIATTRSLVLLLCAAFLLADPVLGHSDVVASIVAFSIITIIALLLLVTTLFASRLRKKIELQLISPNSTGVIDANEKLTFLMSVTHGKVIPFFRMSVDTIWEDEDLQVPTQVISAHREDPLPIPILLTFPHCGVWKIKSFAVSVSDIFGLGSYRWELPEEKASFIVRPPIGDQTYLPVISSRQREGDDSIDVHNRRGEPFDLKSYHPSDGIKKIVWKLYAKSGQLVARQPEPAMTPEGEVITFIYATADDDNVCSTAINYLRSLTEIGLEIRVGCLGMEDRSPAKTHLSAEKLLIDAVWKAKSANEKKDLDHFLAQTGNVTETVNILIFFSKKHLQNGDVTKTLLELGNHLIAQRISPIFFPIAELAVAPEEEVRTSRFPKLEWFVDGVKQPPAALITQTEFFSRCFSQQWQIVEP